MLNTAISRDLEEARNLKNLYKGVLESLLARVEEGSWQVLSTAVEHASDGRLLTWELAGEAGAPCRYCGCDTGRYEPAGDGLTFEFCPACWRMRGRDDERKVSFDVGNDLEKCVRDLPPGMTMTLNLGGERIPLKSPKAALSPESARKALEDYAAEALKPLEIGRQFWMGRMSFNGFEGASPNYREARRWFEMAAWWGHGESLATLGIMALHGLGESRDEGKAAKFCNRAALRGCLEAETGLGQLYWDGVGLPRDPVAAVAWWRRASLKKDRKAQLWLGHALIRGEGVERDLKEGLGLVREAAEAGDAEAQSHLGTLLLEGRAGPPDPREAREWLSRAAGQGHAGAKRQLADLDEEET